MRELLDGIRVWSVWNEDRQLDFNGYLVELGGQRVAIDPVSPGPEDEQALAAAGLDLVIVTNRDHRRAAPALRERAGARLLAPELDAPLLDVPVDGTFRDGELLGGALRVVHLPDQKSPGESALYWAERRVLFLGDALWGKPPGGLTMLPPAKYADPARARASLRRLLELEVDAVLVGDGTPILTGGGAALRAFLSD